MSARLAIAGLIFIATTQLYAQSSGAQGGTGATIPGQREARSCAQEPDPAQCEARRKEMRERMGQAREACASKEGVERRQCMAQQMCSRAADPAKCEARSRGHAEHRGGKASDASRGKHGMRACSEAADPVACEARRERHSTEKRERHSTEKRERHSTEKRERLAQAREACKDHQGSEAGQCLAQKMCAGAADAAKCQARAERRALKRENRSEPGVPIKG